jgi:hypothetical protein
LLDDATLKQRAMAMGLIESTTGVLPPAIKMQAAYAEVLAQTGTIQGDFARTAESGTNAQRRMAAEAENAKHFEVAAAGWKEVDKLSPALKEALARAERAEAEVQRLTDGASRTWRALLAYAEKGDE